MFIHFFCLCPLGLAQVKLKLNTVEPRQFELGYYELSVISNSKSFPLNLLFSSVLFSPEFSNFAWCQFSITFNLGEPWIIYVCDLGIVILLSGMSINVRCCIDWWTKKIILTFGRCENILYLTILNDMVFVKRCLTSTYLLWDFNSDVSKRPYSYYRYRPGTSAAGSIFICKWHNLVSMIFPRKSLHCKLVGPV